MSKLINPALHAELLQYIEDRTPYYLRWASRHNETPGKAPLKKSFSSGRPSGGKWGLMMLDTLYQLFYLRREAEAERRRLQELENGPATAEIRTIMEDRLRRVEKQRDPPGGLH